MRREIRADTAARSQGRRVNRIIIVGNGRKGVSSAVAVVTLFGVNRADQAVCLVDKKPVPFALNNKSCTARRRHVLEVIGVFKRRVRHGAAKQAVNVKGFVIFDNAERIAISKVIVIELEGFAAVQVADSDNRIVQIDIDC